MATTPTRALRLRDRVRPIDLMGTIETMAEVVTTVPGAAGYAPSPHSLSSAHHTGTLGDSQATQFAFIEGEGTDRPAYNANRVTGALADIVPNLTDTYNLGSSTKLWSQAFISQLNAAVYAEQVAQLFGGWAIIGHSQGTLAVASSDLQVETATVVGTVTAAVAQVETATVTGTATANGTMTVTVTAAGMNGGAGLAVSVAFVDGQTASQLAALIQSALGLNTTIAAFFTISGTGANVVLTAQTAAANDGTMNIALSGASGQGFDDHATSTNTTAGVASGAGNATVIVTAAGLDADNTVTLSVAVAAGDTAAQVAAKIETALEADATIAAFFTVSTSSANVVLTAIAYTVSNDATMNVSIDNGTCTGLTAAPTSANTTAGGQKTIIDFGAALAVDDFIVIKAHDAAGTAKTEYMKVVTHPELVTNGTFTSDISGWTDLSSPGGTIAWNAGGWMDITGGALGIAGAAGQAITTVVGESHTLIATIGTADMTYRIGTTSGGTEIASGTAAVGAFSANFVATTTTTYITFRKTGTIATLDGVSVKSTDGTIYTVTRDVAAAHATDPVWVQGTPWLNLGNTGDGRIELNAYDSPRIQLLIQGNTYNAQTEVVRIGDLNAGWGYVAETYGVAIGAYAASTPNITIDSTNGLRIRNYATDVLVLDTSGNADISGKLRMPGASSAIAIGATPPTSASAGTGIWIDRTGIYGLAANTKEFYLDAATGVGTFGAGVGALDADGVAITRATSFQDLNSYKFKSGSTVTSGLSSYVTGSINYVRLAAESMASESSFLSLVAAAPSNYDAEISLGIAVNGGDMGELNLYTGSSGTTSNCRIRVDNTAILGTGGSADAIVGINETPAAGVALAIQGTSNSTSSYALAIRNSTPANLMSVRDDGLVTMDAYGAGTATFSAAGVISSVSDARAKDVIGPLEDVLDKVMQLKPVVWAWKQGRPEYENGRHNIGLTAQDIGRFWPELIGKAGDGMMSLHSANYALGILTKAIQEQQRQIDALTKRLAN